MKTKCTIVAALVVSALALSAPIGAQNQAAVFDVLPVQGFNNTMVYMIVGAGGTVTAQIGEDGVLLVDTGTAENSDKLMATIRRLTSKPIRYIINTHAHLDHAGGNDNILKAIGGQRTSQGGGGGGVENPEGPLMVTHQNTANLMTDMGGDKPVYSDGAIPKSTFITRDKQIYFNGEPIELWWHGNGHTDGDIFVFFRRSDVISAGDFLQTDTYPAFDPEVGGGLQGILDGLNHLIALAVPRFNNIDGTRIIPGHGYLSNQSDLAEVRDMATIIRDRIQFMIGRNMTLVQVKAARPTFDFDPVFGSTTGAWTTDKFIDAVYADLKKPRTGPPPVSGLNFNAR